MKRNRIVATASKTAAMTGGVLAATQHPVLLCLAGVTILIPVVVLVMAAILPTRKYRRDAAFAVLALIVELLHPAPGSAPEQSSARTPRVLPGPHKLRASIRATQSPRQASERPQ